MRAHARTSTAKTPLTACQNMRDLRLNRRGNDQTAKPDFQRLFEVAGSLAASILHYAPAMVKLTLRNAI